MSCSRFRALHCAADGIELVSMANRRSAEERGGDVGRSQAKPQANYLSGCACSSGRESAGYRREKEGSSSMAKKNHNNN